MKFIKVDYLYGALIFIISLFFVFDLFAYPGRPASFDSIIHITTMAQFNLALRSRDFPVVWAGGVANYGLPLGIFVHQLTNYLGALIIFLTNDPVISFNVLFFAGIFFSTLFFYVFLRLYFVPLLAFFGAFLFNFAPYRILNLYVRGAMPEVFSNIFLPLILISMYLFIKKKKMYAFYLLSIFIFLLTLNHPMMLLIYSFIFIPYLLFLLLTQKEKFSLKAILEREQIILLFLSIFALIIGLGMAAYYVIPLNFEIKYLYYGLSKNNLVSNSYLSLDNYLNSNWTYFTKQDIFARGHIIKAGLIETIGVIAGLLYFVIRIIRKRKERTSIFDFALFTSLLIIFFTTAYSSFLYNHIKMLSNIQFPWRMLSAFIFLPPIIYAYLFNKIRFNRILVLFFILLIAVLSFPQLYTKNDTFYSKEIYYFTPYNIQSLMMNTIWSGKSEDYPIEKFKASIISGQGKIISSQIKNSSRRYTIEAKSPLRLVDYTFYFPGWNVYVDGKNVPIEFQDPKYRGVITYSVPAGEHSVLLELQDTKPRKISKIISLIFIGLFVSLIFVKKKISIFAYS